MQRGETNRACFALSRQSWELAQQHRPRISVSLTYYKPNKPRPCQGQCIQPRARLLILLLCTGSSCLSLSVHRFLHLTQTRKLTRSRAHGTSILHNNFYRLLSCTSRSNSSTKMAGRFGPWEALGPELISRARKQETALFKMRLKSHSLKLIKLAYFKQGKVDATKESYFLLAYTRKGVSCSTQLHDRRLGVLERL